MSTRASGSWNGPSKLELRTSDQRSPEFRRIPPLGKAAYALNAEIRTGSLAISALIDWRELNSNPRLVLMLNIESAEGVSSEVSPTKTSRLRSTRDSPQDKGFPSTTDRLSWTTTSHSPAASVPHKCKTSPTASHEPHTTRFYKEPD